MVSESWKPKRFEVLRQTERGENLDADLIERAKAIVERYDRSMMKGARRPASSRFGATS